MRITELEFASLLAYCPYGNSPSHQRSREVRTFIKTDEYVQDPNSPNQSIPMSEWVAQTMSYRRISLPFTSFFQPNTVLVPAPRSSLAKSDTLWVPQRIARELVKRGFGSNEVEYLMRMRAVAKSAFSAASDRPKVTTHFESLAVQGTMTPPEEVILIDDIITRGATLMGAANRLIDVFPNAHIRAFAAMRTISNPDEFHEMYNPCVGLITYRSNQDDTLRRP
jgi:hypothetical protein